MSLKTEDKIFLQRLTALEGHEKGLKENLEGINNRIEILLRQKDELTIALLQLGGMIIETKILTTSDIPKLGECDALH